MNRPPTFTPSWYTRVNSHRRFKRWHCAKTHTVRRARPLRRRAARTRLPALVLIRTRKPWVFFRRRLFG